MGYAVYGYGVGDLVRVVNQVSTAEINQLLDAYYDQYEVPPELRPGGARVPELREAARIEAGMRHFLTDGNFKAFTTTFEDLYGLAQLPGLAVQRLMAEGYGFGAEGDWKTSALVHAMKVMAAGLKGDYAQISQEDLVAGNPDIILLGDGADAQKIADRLNLSTKKGHAQAPQTLAQLQTASETLIGNVTKYVNAELASLPTFEPLVSSYTLTAAPGALTSTPAASSYTLTPKPGALTSTLSSSSYTLTPRSGTPTFTPTITFTPAPATLTSTSTPTIARTPTQTPAPSVELLSANFRSKGIGCQVDITVKVSGSLATGSFHVMNSSNQPVGEIYPEMLLPIGTYGNNVVTLSGNQPATYSYEVWFEYSGVQSNHLTNLVCPLVPKATATP